MPFFLDNCDVFAGPLKSTVHRHVSLYHSINQSMYSIGGPVDVSPFPGPTDPFFAQPAETSEDEISLVPQISSSVPTDRALVGCQ